jgi:hypothetical protein
MEFVIAQRLSAILALSPRPVLIHMAFETAVRAKAAAADRAAE